MEPSVDFGTFEGGLRLGCVVELCSSPAGQHELEGAFGQLVSFDSAAGTYGVTLLAGQNVQVEPKCVRVPEGLRRPGPGCDPSSFDVLLGPRTVDTLLAEEIAECLSDKGFCVLRLCQSSDGLLDTAEAIRTMGETGDLIRLPQEVEEGYLGVGGRGKVFWLDRDSPECIEDALLDSNDETLSYLASLLQPFSADAVGKHIDERTPALVSLSLLDVEEESYPHPMADDKTLGDFLGTWRRGVVRAVHFMGPPTAEVVLEGRDNDAAEALPCLMDRLELKFAPNTILLFRADCYTYECSSDKEMLTMMASFLTAGPQFMITGFDGDLRALRGAAAGPPPPSGELVSVKHQHCRFPCRWDDSGMLNTGFQGASDAVVEIPATRFDLDIYWCPDPGELLNGPPRTVQKHMSFVDGIDLFDHRYFEISKTEASGMGPLQRCVLEVGGNLLYMQGISKQNANRVSHHAGCSVGCDKDDYPTLPDANCSGINALAIIANRFSFVYNMKGPNYVCDTACSASLTATHMAKLMLRDRSDSLEFHLAMGTHLCLSPGPFIGCSMSQMVSPEGRCFTFNASANGYLRGEGTSGVLLTFGAGGDDSEVILRSSALGQDGRSASLTAPNGPSQEEMIWRAIREAKMTPPESTCWECHGTGTSLGDPIEVGAVRRVQIKTRREEPLVLATAKSNIGHLEGGAAMGGILKCVLQVKHGQGIPSLHVRQLNAHLESAAFEAFYCTELVPFKFEQGHSQVSSFGFGGSNGHAIFWGRKVGEDLSVTQQVMRRIAKMKPAEVRPIGEDPEDWEADLPDGDIRPGDRWIINFSPDDPLDAPIKWIRESEPEVARGEEDEGVFGIIGNFNDWNVEQMFSGDVPGQYVAMASIPEGGELEFRFLHDCDRDRAVSPAVPRCTRKNEQVQGPMPDLTNVWLIRGEPGDEYRIELLIVGGRYSVLWLKG